MIIGEIVMWTSGASNVYTPAVARQGDSMTFNIEVLQITAGTLTIGLQSKNEAEDPSQWADLTTTTATAAGLKTFTTTVAEQQLRLRFSLTTAGGAAGDFARVFVYAPIAR